MIKLYYICSLKSSIFLNFFKLDNQFFCRALKYIIIKDMSDFELLIQEIDKFEIEEKEKKFLISKIIIWENSGGDF